VRHALCIALLWIGCDGAMPESDAGSDAGPDAGPPIPGVSALPVIEAGNSVGPGDPLFEGQQRFFYDAFGTERVRALPPADFIRDLMANDPMFADQLAAFGFLPDPNDDFPIGLKPGLEDPTRVTETCALCHVSRLPDGTLWIGPPNLALEQSRFLIELDARWTAAGNEPFLTELDRTKMAALGPGRASAESDGYPTAIPADFPTYFSLGARGALNYLGTGANVRTEVFLSVYTFGAGNPNPREAIVPFPPDARIDPFIAFIGQLEPPPAPAQDAALVASGRTIYEREGCDSCHHQGAPEMLGVVTYDAVERMPGESPDFPRGSIATSMAHRSLLDVDEGVADIFRFITTHGLATRLSDGYRASDLRMLWLTAPYLHNGSVPTLEDLLRPPAERPATFLRGDFLVDTTIEGNGNGGHTFGTEITAQERTALAAYLRSL
jgi:hypothetical protein